MNRESKTASAVEMWEKVRVAHHAMMEAGDEMARLLRESQPEPATKRLTAETRIGPGCVAPPVRPEPAAPAVSGEDEALLDLATRLRAALDDVARVREGRDRAVRDRYDALSVKSRDGLLSSEWIARTGRAERERDEARAALAAAVAEEREACAEICEMQRIVRGDLRSAAEEIRARAVKEAEWPMIRNRARSGARPK